METLNPLARELKSVETMKKQLAQLQEDLSKAHTQVRHGPNQLLCTSKFYFQLPTRCISIKSLMVSHGYGFVQVHLSESRVEHTMRKLAEMESVINDKLLLHKSSETKMEPQIQRTAPVYVDANAEGLAEARRIQASKSGSNILNVSGPTEPYPVWLKNFWYPVAFTVDLKSDIMVSMRSLLRFRKNSCNPSFFNLLRVGRFSQVCFTCFLHSVRRCQVCCNQTRLPKSSETRTHIGLEISCRFPSRVLKNLGCSSEGKTAVLDVCVMSVRIGHVPCHSAPLLMGEYNVLITVQCYPQ